MKSAIQDLLLIGLSAACALAQNVIPPGTGDPRWLIAENTITEEPATSPVIVTKLASGWAPAFPGASWIGPAADQTNATRSGLCCRQDVTYQVNFDLPNDVSKESLLITLYADDHVEVYLNGTSIYKGIGQQYATAVTSRSPRDSSPGSRIISTSLSTTPRADLPGST